MKPSKDIEAKRLGNSVKGPEVLHTPTPWKTGKTHNGTRYVGISTEEGFEHIHCVHSPDIGDKLFPAMANAEFIVRAVNNYERTVNSHAELVEALRKIYETVCNVNLRDRTLVKEIAKEALIKAEETL